MTLRAEVLVLVLVRDQQTRFVGVRLVEQHVRLAVGLLDDGVGQHVAAVELLDEAVAFLVHHDGAAFEAHVAHALQRSRFRDRTPGKVSDVLHVDEVRARGLAHMVMLPPGRPPSRRWTGWSRPSPVTTRMSMLEPKPPLASTTPCTRCGGPAPVTLFFTFTPVMASPLFTSSTAGGPPSASACRSRRRASSKPGHLAAVGDGMIERFVLWPPNWRGRAPPRDAPSNV